MVSKVQTTRSLNLYTDFAGSGKGIVNFRHVEHRDDTVIVPAVISKRTTIVAGKENDVEVGNVDWRLVSKGKTGVRRDESNGCIRTRYAKEGGIKDLDERWG